MKDSEAEELRRFQKMQVYDYEGRQRAMLDDNRIFVKVTWVRVKEGTQELPNIRCRLFA